MASKAHHDSDRTEIGGDNGTIVFYPRALNIVWGADTRYWRLPEKQTDREKTRPAELIQVSWLEVTGTTDPLNEEKSYKISFELSLKPDAFGWNGCQLYLMAKLGRRGRYKWTKVTFKDQPNNRPFTVPAEDFVIKVPPSTDAEDRKLYFGLYEVWSGKWKGGLEIHKAEVAEVAAGKS
ncbi:hypothetical protein L484_018467 [Morus notabilis]|uniref:Protein PHLOEM PROTEIN 2-LIKE A9 n=1 Tax=Morus notabilis TaxID=981085 RepID=W9S3K5_9ROSA|nr:protein PHLOEM PROTEIN 2-LIKE A9 [Morus notabilis]EXC24753.1 hypothetical protein L484_018467 [Morus notabilis]